MINDHTELTETLLQFDLVSWISQTNVSKIDYILFIFPQKKNIETNGQKLFLKRPNVAQENIPFHCSI